MGNSSVNIDGVSGQLSIDGDVAGRDVVKKDSDIGRVADAVADQSKTQSDILKMMTSAFIEAKRDATEAQKQIAETTKNCNKLLREQSDRHNDEIDRILNATREKIEELDNRVKAYKKEIDDAYQVITDSNQTIDKQRREIDEKEKIIAMQKTEIENLKECDKIQAAQIKELQDMVGISNGQEETITDGNFHHPE